MKLNIQDRFILMGVLPQKGNFETMKAIESLRSVIFPSEDEVLKFGVSQEGGNVTWNKDGKGEVDIEVSSKGEELIMDAFKKLSDSEELTVKQYATYKKII